MEDLTATLILLIYYGPPIYIFVFLIRGLLDPSKTLSWNKCGLIFLSLVAVPTMLLLLAIASVSDAADWKGATGRAIASKFLLLKP